MSPAPGLRLQDEGSTQGQITTINLTGSGVSCSKSGAVGTCNVSAGGSGNTVEVTISFGSSALDQKTTTVTGQTWVTSSSVINCGIFGKTVVGDNDSEDPAVEELQVQTSNRVVGTGFDLIASSPMPVVGTFYAHCFGQ